MISYWRRWRARPRPMNLAMARAGYERWFRNAMQARREREDAKEALRDIVCALVDEEQHGKGSTRGTSAALARARNALEELR